MNMVAEYLKSVILSSKTRTVERLSSNASQSTIDTSEHGNQPTRTWHKAVYDTVFWTPSWCRCEVGKPPLFSIWHNLLFGFACAFTTANMYYSQAILDVLARDFDISYLTVSHAPTLAQCGYAVGLFFLCPLGDILPRRPFVLSLVFLTATLWYAYWIHQNHTFPSNNVNSGSRSV